jgi:hypothetical protein
VEQDVLTCRQVGAVDRPARHAAASLECVRREPTETDLVGEQIQAVEGDAADPYEATYAILNGCRILHTVETGRAVMSKRSAGTWGLETLPQPWHDAIRAAGRWYDGAASPEDNEVLRVTMAPFVEMVRQRLPRTDPRRAGPPRWS